MYGNKPTFVFQLIKQITYLQRLQLNKKQKKSPHSSNPYAKASFC